MLTLTRSGLALRRMRRFPAPLLPRQQLSVGRRFVHNNSDNSNSVESGSVGDPSPSPLENSSSSSSPTSAADNNFPPTIPERMPASFYSTPPQPSNASTPSSSSSTASTSASSTSSNPTSSTSSTSPSASTSSSPSSAQAPPDPASAPPSSQTPPSSASQTPVPPPASSTAEGTIPHPTSDHETVKPLEVKHEAAHRPVAGFEDVPAGVEAEHEEVIVHHDNKDAPVHHEQKEDKKDTVAKQEPPAPPPPPETPEKPATAVPEPPKADPKPSQKLMSVIPSKDEEKQGHEGRFWCDNVFPIRTSRFDLRYLVRGLSTQNHLRTVVPFFQNFGNTPAHIPLHVVSCIPRVREAGCFVRVRSFDNEHTMEKVEAALQEELRVRPIRTNLSIRPVRTARVRGEPFMEDLSARFPSPLLKLTLFANEVVEEKLYVVLRAFGRISNMTISPAVKDVPSRTVMVLYEHIASAVAARNCLHRSFINYRTHTGVSVDAHLCLHYEPRPDRKSKIFEEINKHPRLAALVFAVLLAVVTTILFDPVRSFNIYDTITARYSMQWWLNLLHQIPGLQQSQIVLTRLQSEIYTFFGTKHHRKGDPPLWPGNPDDEARVRRWLATAPDRLLVLAGPDGVGKWELLSKLTDGKNGSPGVMRAVHIRLNMEGTDDELLDSLATSVGFSPGFTMVNMMAAGMDLMTPGASKATSDMNKGLVVQATKVFQCTSNALKQVEVKAAKRARRQPATAAAWPFLPLPENAVDLSKPLALPSGSPPGHVPSASLTGVSASPISSLSASIVQGNSASSSNSSPSSAYTQSSSSSPTSSTARELFAHPISPPLTEACTPHPSFSTLASSLISSPSSTTTTAPNTTIIPFLTTPSNNITPPTNDSSTISALNAMPVSPTVTTTTTATNTGTAPITTTTATMTTTTSTTATSNASSWLPSMPSIGKLWGKEEAEAGPVTPAEIHPSSVAVESKDPDVFTGPALHGDYHPLPLFIISGVHTRNLVKHAQFIQLLVEWAADVTDRKLGRVLFVAEDPSLLSIASTNKQRSIRVEPVVLRDANLEAVQDFVVKSVRYALNTDAVTAASIPRLDLLGGRCSDVTSLIRCIENGAAPAEAVAELLQGVSDNVRSFLLGEPSLQFSSDNVAVKWTRVQAWKTLKQLAESKDDSLTFDHMLWSIFKGDQAALRGLIRSNFIVSSNTKDGPRVRAGSPLLLAAFRGLLKDSGLADGLDLEALKSDLAVEMEIVTKVEAEMEKLKLISPDPSRGSTILERQEYLESVLRASHARAAKMEESILQLKKRI